MNRHHRGGPSLVPRFSDCSFADTAMQCPLWPLAMPWLYYGCALTVPWL